MPVGRVLVIGESPSLGRAILDLLEAEGFSARLAYDPSSEGRPAEIVERYRVLVVASPGPFCDVARRWIRGDFPGLAVLVVGSRDVQLDRFPDLHRIPLPIDTELLLTTVRRLATHEDATIDVPVGATRTRQILGSDPDGEAVPLGPTLIPPQVPLP